MGRPKKTVKKMVKRVVKKAKNKNIDGPVNEEINDEFEEVEEEVEVEEEEEILDKKDFLKEKFIGLLKENHSDKIFRSRFFLDRGGRGVLPDKFKKINDSYFGDFQLILKELSDSGDLEHLSGDAYNNIKIK